MDILVVLNQMVELFLIMGLGYFLMKKSILNDISNKAINELIVCVTTPALIFASMFGENTISKHMVYYVIIISIIIYAILPFVGFLVAKILRVPKNQQNLYAFMVIFSNIGFMGYPVINSIFGEGALFYAAIYNLGFNILVYTYGVYLMCKQSGDYNFQYKELLTPGVILSLFSIICFLLDLSFPQLIVDTCSTVGSVTTPLAMILIGANLAKISIKEVFTDKTIYLFTIIKQIIIPVLAYPILKFFITDTLVLGVLFVLIAMPVGNITVMFAMKYDNDADIASKNVFISTLCSVITIPLCTLLLAI